MEKNSLIDSRKMVLKKGQQYGIGRTCMIKRLSLLTENIKLTMHINGFPLKIPILTDSGTEFDIPLIRKYIQELIPMTNEETDLCAIEATIFGAQLSAIEFYKELDPQELFNYLFTATLAVTFQVEYTNFVDKELPDEIELEEEYILSDKQIQAKSSTDNSWQENKINLV